jgi:N-acetyl-gamma-glutamyl-phosphate reductase
VIRCALVGASGYTGAELAAILLRHPEAEIVGMYGSAREGAARTFSDLHPRFRGECDLEIAPATAQAIHDCAPDAVFLCTPHETSAVLVHELLCQGLEAAILDLSAAFRLPWEHSYTRHYGFTHPRPDLLPTHERPGLREGGVKPGAAVYGLVELRRREIAGASLIAVPGCYPTSVILPLAPLAQHGAILEGSRPIADCISGVSGAGRTPTDRNLFCEVSVQPYGVWRHRHGPEIEAYVGREVVFTPHLGPYDRGIVSTLHVQLAGGWAGEAARELLERTYGGAPFVRVLPAGTWPSVNGVRGTNYCDIGLAAQGGHLIIVSAIDNLVKGASGQAVQCMNVRFGLDESAGLAPAPGRGVVA